MENCRILDAVQWSRIECGKNLGVWVICWFGTVTKSKWAWQLPVTFILAPFTMKGRKEIKGIPEKPVCIDGFKQAFLKWLTTTAGQGQGQDFLGKVLRGVTMAKIWETEQLHIDLQNQFFIQFTTCKWQHKRKRGWFQVSQSHQYWHCFLQVSSRQQQQCDSHPRTMMEQG